MIWIYERRRTDAVRNDVYIQKTECIPVKILQKLKFDHISEKNLTQ